MTDMEEQKMFEEAKAGDPRAQFELSQWARQMSILEPNEERWNRVAAKALVDSAQAGYEPAKKMVEQLLNGGGAAPDTAAPEAQEEKEPVFPEPEEKENIGGNFDMSLPEMPPVSASFYDQEQDEDFLDDEDLDEMIDYERGQGGRFASVGGVLQTLGDIAGKIGAAAAGFAGFVVALVTKRKKASSRKENESYDYEESYGTIEEAERKDGEDEAAPVSRRTAREKKSGIVGFIEDNWPIVKIVGIAVCAVLIVLIILLLLPGKKTEVPVATPMATSVPATPVPTPEPFPNEATLLEIRSTATLQYRPADTEYLAAAQTMTVIAEGAENLRQGPGAGDYPDVVMQLAQGTQVTVYAKHDTTDTDENGNLISWYLLNSGGIWGWMYGPSLG